MYTARAATTSTIQNNPSVSVSSLLYYTIPDNNKNHQSDKGLYEDIKLIWNNFIIVDIFDSYWISVVLKNTSGYKGCYELLILI